MQEAAYQVSQIQITNPALSKPAPTSESTPPNKSWLETMKNYETGYLIAVIPLLAISWQLISLTLGFKEPKQKPYLKMNWKLRKSLLAMIPSFILSPALLILYIWALRVGLIG